MTPINPKNPPPPPGGDDPIEPSPDGGEDMKPERVQLEERGLTTRRLREECLDASWQIVDGGIERRYWIPGGFGPVVDFLEEVQDLDPIMMVDGDAVTLRLEGDDGRLDAPHFKAARRIDERTFYTM